MLFTGGEMQKENKEEISDYLFVTLAAHRCRQLYNGAEPKVEMKNKKLTKVAQEEIFKGLIPYKHATKKAEE
jgi:DNA-directed RNA polymerase subunit K/omega